MDGEKSRRTALGRKLDRLENCDAIGMLDILSNTLEALETAEAAQNARQLRHVGEDDFVVSETPANFESEFAGPGEEPDYSKLATATEVQNAITAVRSGPNANRHVSRDDNESIATSPLTERLGLFSRRQKSSVKRAKDDSKDVPGGLFGVKQRYPLPESVCRYFASVGSTQEKRIIALTAWGITVVGLIVSLMFVTKDFLDSRAEAMIAVHYVSTPDIVLPDLYLCKPQQAMPMFWDKTDGFSGEPTFWVNSITTPGNQSVSIKYPETLLDDNFVEPLTIDIFGNKCTDPGLRLANASRFFEGISKPLKCFPCVHIKRKSQTTVHKQSGAERDFLGVEVASNLVVETCRRTRFGLEGVAKIGLIDLVLEHAEELQKRGILDFSGIDTQKRDKLGNSMVFPSERRPFSARRPFDSTDQFDYIDLIVADIVDVLCNTYLFSGYFYPKPDSQDVSFKYNTRSQRWERVGNGPYMPPQREMFWREPEYNEDGTVKSNQFVPLNEGVHQTMDTTLNDLSELQTTDVIEDKTLRAFLKPEKNNNVLYQVSSLRRTGSLSIFLARSVVNTIESFTARSETIPLHRVDGTTLNFVYSVRLMMDDFLTRQVSDQATVQVTSFLADFFGLIELFLDLSVYTLIVSPIVVSTRRKALLSRARAHSLANPPSPV